MKKVLLMMSLLLMVVVASCKKDTVDVTDLLITVPSSAGGVVVINLEGLVQDTGSKIKDHQIYPSKELQEIISKSGKVAQEDIRILFDGDTGIDPKGVVVFYDSSRLFATVCLYDADKFCEFIEKQSGGSFIEESGVKICDKVAVKGNQAWICLSSYRRIDADAIAGYASLKDSQSFLVTPMGEELLTDENDVRGWILLGATLDQFLSRSTRTMFTLGAGFVFEDPESVEFKIDFKKGELEVEGKILNDKYKPAKYLLPADKVDVATLKTLGETCDGMMAFNLNSELIKKFDKLGQSFGGALFGNLNETFKNVDGTVGVAVGAQNKDLEGVITTKGGISPELQQMMSQMGGTLKTDGKYVRFSQGTLSGSLQVAECAEDLKGSCLGFVINPSTYSNITDGSQAPVGFNLFVLKLKPESGGLEIEIEAKTANPDENALLTVMKNQGLF